MLSSDLFSIGLLGFIAVLLVIPSLRKLPGIGVLPTLMIITLVVRLRGAGWEQIGLVRPLSWAHTIGFGLLFGILIALASTIIIEPLSERLTGARHDLSALGTLRGDLQNTLVWISAAWLMAATLEEIIFRGFMMRELAQLLGTSVVANTLNILITSIIFGFAHWYQSRAGALSTGIVSVLLGAIFVWNEFNLWLLIFTHGFIDTLGLLLIYLGWDENLNHILFKDEE
jgi:membrane protease YdiL (CAAX protease family)